MADYVKINLLGDRELMRKLDKLSDAAGKRTLRKAMRAAAAPVAREARQQVPVRTRALKRSIGTKFRFYRGTGTDVAVIGPRTRKGEEKIRSTGWFSTKTTVIKAIEGYHGHLVEFGTVARYTKNGAFRGIMPANPFMRRAWDLRRKEAETLGVQKLREEVEKEARRGG